MLISSSEVFLLTYVSVDRCLTLRYMSTLRSLPLKGILNGHQRKTQKGVKVKSINGLTLLR